MNTQPNLPAIAGNLLAGLRNATAAMPANAAGGGGIPLLRLMKSGQWALGQSNDRLGMGETLVALNLFSAKHGWTCWENKPAGQGKNAKLGEIMLPLSEMLPPENTLPDKGWPWSQQVQVEGRIVNGPFAGRTLLYKVSSLGGLEAMHSIFETVGAMIQTGEAGEFFNPVVRLGTSFYNHSQYGETAKPDLTITDWCDMEGRSKSGAPLLQAPGTQPVQQPAQPAQQPVQQPVQQATTQPAPQPAQVAQQPAQPSADDTGGEAGDAAIPARRRRRA